MKTKSSAAAHVGLWMETPDGHDVHILGDRKMSKAARKAIGEMMDAVYKADVAGKHRLRSSFKMPDDSIAIRT